MKSIMEKRSGVAPTFDDSHVREFAAAYAAAWSSQDAGRVASFFAGNGTLRVNGGAPVAGRAALTAFAQGFMTDFPDLRLSFDALRPACGRMEFHWTLTGTYTGPGGNGRSVCISGHESWRIGEDGLIADSLGHFDEADYRRQLGAD